MLTEVGEISSQESCVKTIVYSVPDFLNLPQKVGYCIRSPNFTFLGNRWDLKIYPNGKTTYNSNGWIGLFLVQTSGEECFMKYTLGIRKVDGTNCATSSSENNFGALKGYGCPTLIQVSVLKRESTQLLRQGTVTFFCRLETRVKGRKEAYTENLLRNLKNLLKGDDADVLLRVKDQEFKAHRAILKVRSPVFKSLFSRNMKENNSGNVDITDCNPEVFTDCLHFLYCGKIQELYVDNVFDLFFVADKYDVRDLRTICVEFIMNNISKDNFFDTLNLALIHNESMILENTTTFFIQNAIEIMESVEWLSFQKQNFVAANELVLKFAKKQTI